MSGWRQFAESIQHGDVAAAEVAGAPEDRTFVPFVPIVPKAPLLNPARALRDWHDHLVAIDDCRVPAGQSIMWWQQACDDARWIYENFASRAVRDGWSAHDLFGVLPWHPGWGGLCDRIKGARNLKMEGQRAAWSSWGVPDWACSGAGDQLVTSGIVLIWEMG